MKNYDETINTVFERIEDYKLKKKRKKKILTKTVLPIGSLCIAALIGIAVWQSDIFKTNPPIAQEDSTVVGEKDYIEPNETDGDLQGDGQETLPNDSTNNTSSTDNDPIKMLCYINQIESIKSSDIAPPHPLDDHYHKDLNIDEAIKYLGIDFSIVNEKYDLDSSNCGAWYKKSDDTIVMDHNAFAYSNEKVSFHLEASKNFEPGSCIVVPTEEIVSTMIGTRNGPVYVKFYGTVGTVVSQNHSDKQATMIAEFQHKGVNFRVKANDISAFAFYQFVSAVANG